MPENKSIKIIFVFFTVLLVGSSLILYGEIKLKDESIITLLAVSENQKETIESLEKINIQLEQNLSVTEKLLNTQIQTRQELEKEILNYTMVAKSDYAVLAVDDNEKGYLIPVEVIIKNGKGSLFMNVANILFDETLQSSAQTAVLVGKEVSGKNLSDKDVLINIEALEQAQRISISGGSAGAAITLAVIAALQGKSIKNDVYITGTINEDHTLGKIAGAKAKALVAKEIGAVLFLVPKGQLSDVSEVGIDVMEVADIEDAVKLAIE